MRRLGRLLPLLAGLVLLGLGLLAGDLENVREQMTYRDFDVPSDQSAVQYLSPGLPDRAHEGAYTFGGPIHATPLIALGIIFVVFYLWRNLGSLDLKLGIQRGMTQWLGFVLARLGMFRVAGALPVARCSAGVFPFLNCQACEMATGACPIGQVQNSLLRKSFPAIALGTLLVTGALLGRWICGWLCPFGLFSDMMDRISLRRFRPAHLWRLGGYVALALLVLVSGAFVWWGVSGQAPFCSTVCASGKLYGLLPYYATTAAPDVADIGASDGLPVFVYHAALFALFLVLAVLISGRVFCRYLCPMGAFLGLFHKVSATRIVHHAESCSGCDRCLDVCPMGIDLAHDDFLTQSSCIRCARCVAVCARGARTWEFPWTKTHEREPRHVHADAPEETVPAV